METITSLAVNPSETQLVAYASAWVKDLYNSISFIWVVSTAEGHYVTEVTRIEYFDSSDG